MADLRVTRTGKDLYGDITALCGSGWQSSKADAINHIENRWHTYFVQDPRGHRADIRVVNGPTGKYLRTDPNTSCTDNLDTLPNC